MKLDFAHTFVPYVMDPTTCLDVRKPLLHGFLILLTVVVIQNSFGLNFTQSHYSYPVPRVDGKSLLVDISLYLL